MKTPRRKLFNRRKENPVAGLTLAYYGGRPQYSKTDIAAFAREGYMQNPDVYAAIEIGAKACGGVEWYAERLVRGSWERLDSHPMLDLIQRPRPGQTNTSFIGDLVRWHCIAGQFYITRNLLPKGPPRELWTLRPDRMQIIPGTTAAEAVAGYEHTIGGRKQVLPPDMVLHLPLFHPQDDFYGLSPLEAAARLVDQANAAADFNLGLLQNGGIPPGFLMTQDELSDVEFKAFKDEMRNTWGAAKNAGLPQLLEGGMTWQDAGRAPKDMEMLEAQRMFALKFAQVIGIPPEFLSGAGEKKYANYGEARKALYTEFVLPKLDQIRDAFNGWLGPMFGDDVRLCYDSDDIEALQEDRSLVWQRVQAADFLTINEKREELGFPPVKGGDVVMVPFSLTPISEASAAAAQVDAGAQVDASGQKKKSLNLDESARITHWKRVEAQRIRLETKVEKMVRDRLVGETGEYVAAIGAASTGPGAVRRLDDAITAQSGAWLALLTDVYTLVGKPFAEQTLRELKHTHPERANAAPEWLQRVREYIRSVGGTKITNILDTTREKLIGELEAGIAEGESIPKLAERVSHYNLENVVPNRARVIARTETVSASNAGSIAAAESTGLDLVKQWISTGDNRTRESHQSVDSVPMGEPFQLDGGQLDFPGDSSYDADPGEIIQCRCAIGYETA